nr:MAG TPA: hypothetical protein [Caudoviricetes sp.]
MWLCSHAFLFALIVSRSDGLSPCSLYAGATLAC